MKKIRLKNFEYINKCFFIKFNKNGGISNEQQK